MKNKLDAKIIKKYLSSDWAVAIKESTGSTNNDAKSNGMMRNSVFLAEEQTLGKGRLGRFFYSPSGDGLYMSALVKVKATADDSGLITAFASVAVARAVEKLSGVKTEIKWVNDVFINGKKICGILTEGVVGSNGKYDSVVIGIGINVLEASFPAEIAGIATSVYLESGKKPDRNELCAMVLNELDGLEAAVATKSFIEEYRSRSCVIGKRVFAEGGSFTVLGISDECKLIVEDNGRIKEYSPDEITLHAGK